MELLTLSLWRSQGVGPSVVMMEPFLSFHILLRVLATANSIVASYLSQQDHKLWQNHGIRRRQGPL